MRIGILLALISSASVLSSTPLWSRAESAFNGRTYYVSVSGDDRTGDGSSKHPWASISAAIQHISEDGGLLLVRDGLYAGNVRISRKFARWLIIQSEHPYRALLRNAQGQTLSIWDSANVVVAGFDIARSTPLTHAPLAAQIARADNVALIDNIIHDSFNNDVLKINESCHNLLILGNVFYNQQGPAGQLIDVNGGRDVFIHENVFFNDSAHSALKDLRETHGFLVAKSSGDALESRRLSIARNVWLNFEGGPGSNFILLGEDAKPFYEVQEVSIENNLMIGNSPIPMRAALGIKGAQRVLFAFNTVVGDLPARAFAARINREGENPVNRQITFVNNIWSSPAGTMTRFAEVAPSDAEALLLRNNLYWNGGRPIPGGDGLLMPESDSRKLVANPLITTNPVILPYWDADHFLSGAHRIRDEFTRLVRQYGFPEPNSPSIGRGNPDASPGVDIRGAPRGSRPDIGAIQVAGVVPSLRVFLLPQRVSEGETTLNYVALETPAPPSGTVVQLSSSNPALVAVPARITVLPGQTTVLFPIRITRSSQPSSVMIEAHAPQARASARLAVVPPAIDSIALSSAEVWAGESRHKLFLESSAEGDVTSIRLSSSLMVTVPVTAAPV
ncbi:MAG: hypothetical protein M1541_22340 [Acidobacteria bacterium]|nr:hypothetical protein [Acidobacteriota bacterium]